jgi:hypothetical protein
VGYYYLIPQLSFLIYGQTPPMSPEEFKELAVPQLNKHDAALLGLISLDPLAQTAGEEGAGPGGLAKVQRTGAAFIDGWNEWERALRLNLAKFRAAKLKREAPLADAPNDLTDAVSAAWKAVQEPSPLEGEEAINRARWNAIDALTENGSYFSRDTVFAYLLKLMILKRKNSFQAQTGFTEYKSLYASILEQSGTISAGDSK